jgi:hypothetical protein
MRRALLDGVVNGDDIRRTHDVCGSCNTKKREHYRALADGWQRWRKGKDLIVNLRGEDWCQQGLVVRVAPPIIVRSKNHRDLVWLYYKEPGLTSDAARIANRIIQLSIPSEIGRPAVLDVRRAKLHRMGSRLPKGFDALLNAEVSAFRACTKRSAVPHRRGSAYWMTKPLVSGTTGSTREPMPRLWHECGMKQPADHRGRPARAGRRRFDHPRRWNIRSMRFAQVISRSTSSTLAMSGELLELG